MGPSLYCLPLDIITDQATISVPLGTESSDPNYKTASLYNRDPSRPMKFVTNGPNRLVFNLKWARSLDAVAIPQHNFADGLDVRIQANDTDAWTSPALDVPMVISAKDSDGHVKHPFVDLTDQTDPLPNFQYWSIYIPINTAPPELGEVLLMSDLRQFVRPLSFGVQRVTQRAHILSVETEYGVKAFYNQNVKQLKFTSSVLGSEADRVAMATLLDACYGPIYPFFFALDGDDYDGGYYVRCTEEMSRMWSFRKIGGGTYELPLEFEELSRGLPL
jgi:hypothetical protein